MRSRSSPRTRQDVRTLVAHEPPTAHVLPDRAQALAATEDIRDTYQSDGFGPAMAKFIALVGHEGPVPADFAESVNPDPAMFGLPAEDDGGRERCARRPEHHHVHPLRARLRRAAHGLDEDRGRHRRGVEGQMARRGGEGVAERLGSDPVVFPGGHGGFLGDEYGQPGDPDGFAAKLREVLA